LTPDDNRNFITKPISQPFKQVLNQEGRHLLPDCNNVIVQFHVSYLTEKITEVIKDSVLQAQSGHSLSSAFPEHIACKFLSAKKEY
jgi:hypothetical protein